MLTTSLVFLGHVDHGKSTILGHFLYQIGIINERTKKQAFAEAEKSNMEKWSWAFLLDSLAEERARGKTSDIAFQPFETENQKFMLIDTPGHRDFVPATIRGATQADACILVVSAEKSDLSSGLKINDGSNPGGQTRELAIIGSVLGIENVIVVINKMDAVNYTKNEYESTVKKVMDLFKDIQSPWLKKISKNSFIPISGWFGDNLTKKSENMKWYEGPTLSEALDQIPISEEKKDKGMRFLGQDIYDIAGLGTVINGRVIEGKLNIGDMVTVLPEGTLSEVKSLMTFREEETQLLDKGSYGIVQLKGINRDNLDTGTVLAPASESKLATKNFIDARVLVLESTERPLIPGKSLIMHCGTNSTSVRIEEIISIEKQRKQRKQLGSVKIAYPGDLITMKLSIDSPIVIEKFIDQPILGRIILRNMGNTVAVGIVTNFN